MSSCYACSTIVSDFYSILCFFNRALLMYTGERRASYCIVLAGGVSCDLQNLERETEEIMQTHDKIYGVELVE